MHLLLPAAESAAFLLAELQRAQPSLTHELLPEGLIRSAAPLDQPLVFCQQALPHAQPCQAASIRLWSELLFAALAELPEQQPWQLHVWPVTEPSGTNRCRLIRETLLAQLKQHRRQRLKTLTNGPFTPATTLVQLLLTGPEHGWLSVAPPPLPSHLVVPFVGGRVPVAVDKAAPARAFAKLVEAETRLGRPIAPNERCADLGAAPGSWTYVALQRGAQVLAVDRAPLRPDLMRNSRLKFRRGDAFAYAPEQTVDWLLCDVIAAPERSIGLLLDWLRQRRCRWFVVTIKFKGTENYPALDRLKLELPALCRGFQLRRLAANKNEACAFGQTLG